MKKILLTVAGIALVAPTTALANHRGRWWCNGHFYTPAHVEAHARHVYKGTRKVTGAQLRRLAYMEMCVKPSSAEHRVRVYDRRLGRRWHARYMRTHPPLSGYEV